MYIEAMTRINTDLLDSVISMIGKNDILYLVMSSKTRLTLASGNRDCVSYEGADGTNYTKYRDIPITIYEGMMYGDIEFVTETKNRAINTL